MSAKTITGGTALRVGDRADVLEHRGKAHDRRHERLAEPAACARNSFHQSKLTPLPRCRRRGSRRDGRHLPRSDSASGSASSKCVEPHADDDQAPRARRHAVPTPLDERVYTKNAHVISRSWSHTIHVSDHFVGGLVRPRLEVQLLLV